MLDKNEIVTKLQKQRSLMIEYLDMKRKVHDWHAIMDAAADIREIEAKLALINEINK